MYLHLPTAVKLTLVSGLHLALLTLQTGLAQEATQPWRADPGLVEKLSKNGNEFIYDEAKVPEYSLPDPLRFNDDTVVASAQAWNSQRRAELMELFRDQVYGQRPESNYTVQYEQVAKQGDVYGGKATGLSMKAVVSVGERTFEFPFVVFIPNKPNHKAPAIVLINNREFLTLEQMAEGESEFWPSKTLIERGYATASFFTSDVDPDRKDGYDEGIRSFLAAGAAPADDAWRSLSAWGWAASRVLDYLHSLDSVDASRSAVVGHSRGGKTALWAAAEDPRFSIAYSNNSGCGGAALSRRAYGETVARITSVFPHWFCKNFSAYGGREGDLPVDQHELIGLIAPRAVYVTSADEDLWADPRGEYAALVAAAPVFALLGEKSISEPAMPPLNAPRVTGQTGYHIRTGGHGLESVDWSHFLDFADGVFKK